MKLTCVLLIAASLTVSASGVAQTVTLNEKNVGLEKVFKEINRQTGFNFLYNSKTLKTARKVTINVKDAPLKEALQICFQQQALDFIIQDNTIVVKEKSSPVTINNSPVVNIPPPIDVKGRIVNENGDPVLATVMVKGTNKGATTNNYGYFELKDVDNNATLVITASNIETKEIQLNGKNDLAVIIIQMKNTSLDELQIIAYGKTTKRLLTGNISSVKAADIEKQPVNNVLLALEGRVPGLYITQSTGLPGTGVKVQIQGGLNSIANGNDPFYVVDGVPFNAQLLPTLSSVQGNSSVSNSNVAFSGNPLSFINPQDIESIEVLKDADATAIYGSRAANGAILITTKKGRAGQTKVDINVQSGIGQVAKRLDLLNTQQYLDIRRKGFQNDGLPVPNSSSTPNSLNYDLTVWDPNRYTDWQEVFLGGKAHYTDAQASFSGGSSTTQFRLGTNFHRETLVFPGDFDDKKGAVQFNVNHASNNKRFTLNFSGNYLVDDNRLPNTDQTSSIMLPPNGPELYDTNGNFNWELLPSGASTWSSPIASIYRKYQNKSNNLVANAELGYEIFKGLKLKSSFGYTKLQSDELTTSPIITFSPENRASNPRLAQYANSSRTAAIIEPQLTYQLSKSAGKFDFLIGSTFQTNNDYQMAFRGSGYSSDGQLENIQAASSVTVSNSIQTVYKYNALFGRIGYNYQDKYLVNLSARRDGSSRFGSENLFHNFYAIGAAWIFTGEEWIQRFLPFLNFGKLKLSYGTTGNDQVGDYSFMSLYSVYTVDSAYGRGSALIPSGLNNPFLQWEETRKVNVGLDVAFFNNRISISANYYRNRSSNQLVSYLLPIITGFPFINENLNALVQNSGIEVGLTTDNVRVQNFHWTSNFNVSINRNKLLEFPGLAQSAYATTLAIGFPTNIGLKAYKYAGVNPQTGLYQFQKADGSLTGSPASTDRTEIQNTNPEYFGGFQNSLTYKNFSLDVLFQFVKKLGRDNNAFGNGFPGSIYKNQVTSVLSYWQKPGDITSIQMLSATKTAITNQVGTANASDAAYVDASYIRLKNLSISYRLPNGIISKAHLQNARIYLQGQNLLTITNFPGLDPETLSYFSLPPLRVVTVGIQLTF